MEVVFQTIPVINLHRCHWIWRTWLNIEMFTHSNFRIHTFSRTKSINGLHTDCNALVVEKLSRVFSELSRFEVNDTRWSALPPTRMTLNAPLAKSKLPCRMRSSFFSISFSVDRLLEILQIDKLGDSSAAQFCFFSAYFSNLFQHFLFVTFYTHVPPPN